LCDDEDFVIPDRQFKVIIATSLPPSWDLFTDQYIGGGWRDAVYNPKKLNSVQQFIGLIREEYSRRNACAQKAESVHQAITGKKCAFTAQQGNTQSTQRNDNHRAEGKLGRCKHCKHDIHKSADCLIKNGVSCEKCHKIGHLTSKCWAKPTGNEAKGQTSGTANTAEQTASIVEVPENTSGWEGTFSIAEKLTENVGQRTIETEEPRVEELTKIVETPSKDDNELIDFLTDDEEDMKEFYKTYQWVYNSNENDKSTSLYDWLADSATTSHIANRHEFFTKYKPQSSASVSGVGNTKVVVTGRGTVVLESKCDGLTHVLRLRNVLHIPSNMNNLISLGKWEAARGEYRGRKGTVSMTTADG